ncbi:helix-turn-helix transcriptional regulator [Calothrix membranacea FACHB-236]|uniref:PadR family transcriptional regulator n=1 Tax=Tolypothrix sp. PCC 7910 TaxID=2099387 RepID=UPI00142780BD|nr:PadR family transcriptional regulator [Tolypothrix sp. PCC 7910]MBD2166849.1 helix-turn-helix transcriptional regulator [Calothrix membranacea FACHB-236]MBD2210436.1 helix-turn-helix transcriptional regulator [Nostoc linckia FACHB-104]QIR35789.1 helix-turn-helix transcriptional regulator [Tolypothrix sp. PCC 7910]
MLSKKELSLYDISYTEQLIICALYQRELYGLAIQDHVKRSSNNEIKIEAGSLYPALAKLERKGLVNSRWGENRPNERRGARRKYYTLTSKGITMSDEIFEFLNRLRNCYPLLDPT